MQKRTILAIVLLLALAAPVLLSSGDNAAKVPGFLEFLSETSTHLEGQTHSHHNGHHHHHHHRHHKRHLLVTLAKKLPTYDATVSKKGYIHLFNTAPKEWRQKARAGYDELKKAVAAAKKAQKAKHGHKKVGQKKDGHKTKAQKGAHKHNGHKHHNRFPLSKAEKAAVKALVAKARKEKHHPHAKKTHPKKAGKKLTKAQRKAAKKAAKDALAARWSKLTSEERVIIAAARKLKHIRARRRFVRGVLIWPYAPKEVRDRTRARYPAKHHSHSHSHSHSHNHKSHKKSEKKSDKKPAAAN